MPKCLTPAQIEQYREEWLRLRDPDHVRDGGCGAPGAARGVRAADGRAAHVRGEDRRHRLMAEPQPSRDLDPEFVALHRTIARRNTRILYRDTDVASRARRPTRRGVHHHVRKCRRVKPSPLMGRVGRG
jgi:hypothetical protein